jgi:hypothetical protein
MVRSTTLTDSKPRFLVARGRAKKPIDEASWDEDDDRYFSPEKPDFSHIKGYHFPYTDENLDSKPAAKDTTSERKMTNKGHNKASDKRTRDERRDYWKKKRDDAFNRSFEEWAANEAPSHLAAYDPTTHTLKKKKVKKIRSKGHLTSPKRPESDSPASHGGEAASMPMPTRGSHPGAHIKTPYTRPAISQYKTYAAPTSQKRASHKGVLYGHQGANNHGHEENFNEEFENDHDSMRAPETFDGRRVKEENLEDYGMPANEDFSTEVYASDETYGNDGHQNFQDHYETCVLCRKNSTHQRHECNGDKTPIRPTTRSRRKTRKSRNRPKPHAHRAAPSQPKHRQRNV